MSGKAPEYASDSVARRAVTGTPALARVKVKS